MLLKLSTEDSTVLVAVEVVVDLSVVLFVLVGGTTVGKSNELVACS